MAVSILVPDLVHRAAGVALSSRAPTVDGHDPDAECALCFGDIDTLKVTASIETHGRGARGFNLYDGSLKRAEFESITTHDDGAIGVQLSKPFGTIRIDGDVRTKGGEGDSLVRGKVVHLKAHAFSIKPGTAGDTITIAGEVVSENEAISDWDFAAPANVVKHIEVGGETVT
jgi:hypothetical protein